MQTSEAISRRRFFHSGLIGAAALTSSASLLPEVLAGTVKPERDPCHGLKLGVTSYTLRKFSLDQAVAMARQVGMKYISLKDVHLPLQSSKTEREEARRKVEAAGLMLMGGGVIDISNNPEQIRNVFDYAKEAGMPTIICSPQPEALDKVEAMAREYDVRIAIHNHGPGDKRYPSPLDVLRAVKTRDQRMGLCMDVGHTVRIGQDPVEMIEQCRERLYDFHMKDVTAAKPEGTAIEVGRGIIDIVGVLKSLLRIKYSYHVALEYEAHADDPLPGMIESFAYLCGALAAIE